MAWGYDTNQMGNLPGMPTSDQISQYSAFNANSAPQNITPQTNAGGSLFGGLGSLGNGGSGILGLGQLGLSGLGTIGNLWTAMGALDLAKKQYNFNKNYANANLANQTQSYNTALSDRANARYFTENKPQSEADAYIASNKLSNKTV